MRLRHLRASQTVQLQVSQAYCGDTFKSMPAYPQLPKPAQICKLKFLPSCGLICRTAHVFPSESNAAPTTGTTRPPPKLVARPCFPGPASPACQQASSPGMLCLLLIFGKPRRLESEGRTCCPAETSWPWGGAWFQASRSPQSLFDPSANFDMKTLIPECVPLQQQLRNPVLAFQTQVLQGFRSKIPLHVQLSSNAVAIT